MKIILTAIMFLVASLHGAEPKENFPEFMNLDKKTAAATARKQAETDLAAGTYRILVFGLRMSNPPFDQRLKKAGVQVKAIAGCVVNDGILEGARVYNEIMREKLKAKLGYDVFDKKAEPQTQPAK